jgi:hypothetical protein
MATFGYKLCSEEHAPDQLVRFGKMAEERGFSFAMISDHFHPWVDAQGQSPFAWSVLGALAVSTSTLELGTGVTCPTMRIHPALVAQAAAEGISGRLNIVIDAQRGEFYHAAYDLEDNAWRLVEPIQLISLDKLRPQLASGSTAIWPELAAQFPEARILWPEAATLGLLASGRTDFVPAESLEPIYLRAPTFSKAPPPRVIPSL